MSNAESPFCDPLEKQNKFATSISCMDGRIQIPLYNWIKTTYRVNYVDVITEPGVDKKMSEDVGIETIRDKVLISVNAHKSQIVAVSGHYDCAANPVDAERHMSEINNAVAIIKSWDLGVNVIGLWVDDSWNVNLL